MEIIMEHFNRKTIFSNIFTLRFKNPNIQNTYNINFHQKSFKYLLIINVLIQFANLSFLFFFIDSEKEEKSPDIKAQKLEILDNLKPLTLAISVVPLISIVLWALKYWNRKLDMLYGYSIYFFYGLIVENTIIITTTWISFLNSEYSYMVYNIDFLASLVYVLIFECNFLKISVSNVLLIICYIIGRNGESLHDKFSFSTSKVIFSVFIYLLERLQKIYFYNNVKLQWKIKWLDSIVMHMQSGVFIVKQDKVEYLNEFSKRRLNFLFEEINLSEKDDKSEILDILHSDQHFLTSQNENNLENELIVRKIKKDIFNNLDKINPDLPDELKDQILKKSFNEIKLEEGNFKKDFKFVGTKNFFQKGEVITLEFYLRINEFFKKKFIEIFFNDVSKIKEIEETKAQMKYQSIFLSKVAHEFKNPFIGIMSLIDEILEKRGGKNTIEKNLTLIKNLSLYMMYLVKDFEMISNNTKKIDFEIYNTTFNLVEEMKKIKNIVETLLHTLSKSKTEFLLNVHDDIPVKINLDKMRLYQILLNLLTNSIKFTQRGYIKLTVSCEVTGNKKFLTFTVEDTGKGIPYELKNNLFKKFVKEEIMNNDYGSGLGLATVDFLCSKLGSKIEHKDNYPVGSIFSFSFEFEKIKYSASLSKRSEDTVFLNNYQPNKQFMYDTISNNHTFSYFHKGEMDMIYEKSYLSESKVNDKKNVESTNFRNPNIISINKQSENNYVSFLNNEDNIIIISDLDHLIDSDDENSFSNTNTIRIIVVDDDSFVRKSTVRVINKMFQDRYRKTNVDIIEVSDGIECLYVVYNNIILNKVIHLIVMDETMKFMNGSYCSRILNEILISNNITRIPIYIVTAYESNFNKTKFNESNVQKIYSKPFSESMLLEMINFLTLDFKIE